jgi:hypothetical protein
MSAELLHWLAAGSALVTFAVHTFVGGVVVARPLLADASLPRAAKWLAYYCWHIATVTLLALAAAFAWSAATADATLALGAAVFCAALSILSAGVALRGGIAPLRFPSTSLFALTAALGFAGFAA